jgi:hypothetical protein
MIGIATLLLVSWAVETRGVKLSSDEKRELPMSEQDVAMRIAVASAFRDCGLPSDEQDVDDFLVALRSFGYVVERLVESRTDDE